MSRPAVISIPNFRRVDSSLRQLGVDTSALYAELGISNVELTAGTSRSRVSIHVYLDLLNLAAERHAHPHLGIEIARNRSVADHGMLGYMIRNAPNFGSCLGIVESYIDLVMPGGQARVQTIDQHCFWTYDVPGYAPSRCRQEVEMGLMQFVRTTRELLDRPDWRPQRVCFRHAPPRDVDTLRRAFDAEPIFDHPFSGIEFPAAFMELPISDADPALLGILEQQVQRSMHDLKFSDTLLARIAFLISSQLGQTNLTSDKLAAYLGMSRRTLHRRLAELGTSFSEIRNTVLCQVATDALATTSVRITELAQQLGYSDVSAFNRAFKRSIGMPPLIYRKAHRTAASATRQTR